MRPLLILHWICRKPPPFLGGRGAPLPKFGKGCNPSSQEGVQPFLKNLWEGMHPFPNLGRGAPLLLGRGAPLPKLFLGRGAPLPKRRVAPLPTKILRKRCTPSQIWEGVQPFLQKFLGRGAPLPKIEFSKIAKAFKRLSQLVKDTLNDTRHVLGPLLSQTNQPVN